jgi:hypothetical protein
MNLSSVANYFNRTPLYGWNGTKWVDLKRRGSVSVITGGMTAPAADRGERRLLSDSPLPPTTYVVRVGNLAISPAYIVGLRGDPVASPNHEEPFSYIVHLAHDLLDIYHPVKELAASGTPRSITWTKVQTIHTNIVYESSPENKLLDSTVFPTYTLSLAANCLADTEDEIRSATHVYTIKNLYSVNELVVASCTRKKVPV